MQRILTCLGSLNSTITLQPSQSCRLSYIALELSKICFLAKMIFFNTGAPWAVPDFWSAHERKFVIYVRHIRVMKDADTSFFTVKEQRTSLDWIIWCRLDRARLLLSEIFAIIVWLSCGPVSGYNPFVLTIGGQRDSRQITHHTMRLLSGGSHD